MRPRAGQPAMPDVKSPPRRDCHHADLKLFNQYLANLSSKSANRASLLENSQAKHAPDPHLMALHQALLPMEPDASIDPYLSSARPQTMAISSTSRANTPCRLAHPRGEVIA
jgi:hypothetical protein